MAPKTKKITLGIIGGVIALFALVILVAPKDFHVERSITINRTSEQVFAYLKSLRRGEQWSPWHKLDPNIKMEYRGTDGTVGAVAAWAGNEQVGEGEQEITAITEGERIDYELRFMKPMEGTSTSSLFTKKLDSGRTEVTWTMDGHNEFPFNVLCLIFNGKDMIGDQFDEGLNNLKTVIER